jgi:hypothetical protein
MNNAEIFEFDLSPGAVQRGNLFRDPGHRYGTGDVLEVEMPDGLKIDLGWDEGEARPFHAVVYRESYGARFIDFRAAEPEEAARIVRLLIDYCSRT